MKIQCNLAVLVCALLFLSPSAFAGSALPGSEGSRTLPVLVTVSPKGEVTRVQSAYDLSPRVQHQVESMIDKMITGPMMKNGKPVSSQAIIKLKLTSAKQQDGSHKVSFAYVSAKPVPYGNWHWAHLDKKGPNTLALVPDQGLNFDRHRTLPPPSNLGQWPSHQVSQSLPSSGGHRH